MPVEKVVKTLRIPAVWFAALMKSSATFSNSAGLRLARFCRRMEKPVCPPMPRTGGGMKTEVFDSSIAARRSVMVSAILSTVRPLAARSRGSSMMAKMAPTLLELEPVEPERPEYVEVWATPGTSSTIALARRTTSSVRDSEAPGGNCSETVMTPRSILGMKPVGVCASSQTAPAISST